jgi:hypothetical protein
MGVLCSIVNSNAKQKDAAPLVSALHLRMVSLSTSIWWEYIPSESNVSDGGSRTGVTDPVAIALGFNMRHIECPQLRNNFMQCMPSDWESFWVE